MKDKAYVKKSIVGSLFAFLSLCILGISAFILLLPALLRLPLHLHINYNEGWNAYHTLDFMVGKPIYTNNLFIPVNYPPLSFYIIGILAHFFGDPLIVGRVVSLISLLGIASLVTYLVFLETRKWYPSVFSGLLVIALFGLLGADYIGMDDPQLLGNFMLMLGLFSFIRFKNIFIMSLLMISALLTKNSILALPIAITFYLFMSNRRNFIKWILYTTLFGGIAIFLMNMMSHNEMIPSLLIKRRYEIANAITLFKSQITPIILLLGVGIVLNKKFQLFWLYLITSLIVGLLFSFGSGTGINMYFDTYIALSLVLGVKIANSQQLGKYIIVGIILLNILAGFSLKIIFHRLDLNPYVKAASEQKDINFISQIKGDVLCEYIDYCYYAHKQFIYDPFLVNELVIQKRIPELEVINLVQTKHFALIELTNQVDNRYFTHLKQTGLIPLPDLRFTENFYRALGNNYHSVGNSKNVYFYIPN